MQDSLNKSLHNRNHNQAAPGVVPSGRGKGDRPKGNERAAAKSRSATPIRTPKGGDRGQPKGTPRGRAVDSGGKGSDDVPGKGVCWAFQKGACTRGRRVRFLTLRNVDSQPRLNPLTRPRSSTPSLRSAPAGSATVVTIYTVAAALATLLPRQGRMGKGKPKGKPAAAAVAVSVPKARVPQPVPGSVALPASTYHGQRVECQSWLMDTGCKYDLTTRGSVPLPLRGNIMNATEPITLHTANGLTDCNLCVSQQIVGAP